MPRESFRVAAGEVFPSIDIARKIADILEVSLDYLTGKEDVLIDKNTSSQLKRVGLCYKAYTPYQAFIFIIFFQGIIDKIKIIAVKNNLFLSLFNPSGL
ncbi:helix-turn-helix domain-containing protein [Chryseobacterium indologenes]|uniref:helix-turn-helix domain-containing protein n=1 Tax=Chryseobacterium indologenes TaxID=253 RepID=UPI001024866E|nr:helix-turn-helix transcriptional regulator [Chryseobacterium indologenes]VFA40230.1 Uncharacterised protein [Chryseobacterium indologenes]